MYTEIQGKARFIDFSPLPERRAHKKTLSRLSSCILGASFPLGGQQFINAACHPPAGPPIPQHVS